MKSLILALRLKKICMNIGEKCIKIPRISLAWDLKNIYEFWRKIELKSLILALELKKICINIDEKIIQNPLFQPCFGILKIYLNFGKK